MSTDYPRPDFVRPDLQWTSLNGPWDFLFDDDDAGLNELWHKKGLPKQVNVLFDVDSSNDQTEADRITQKIAAGTQNLLKGNLFNRDAAIQTHQKRSINVPFVYQTAASGIHDNNAHQVLWYERKVKDIRSEDGKASGHRLLVRFGAVDYEATVWLDGVYIGQHQGGHVPFDLDLTDAFPNDTNVESRLTVRVRDSTYDLTQPRGKQYWGAKPESIFYTPSSGIWQNVWLESVPATRIADSDHGTVLRSDDINSGELHAEIAIQGRRSRQKLKVELNATLEGIALTSITQEVPMEVDTVTLQLNMKLSQDQVDQLPEGTKQSVRDGVALWSPDHPSLYDITIKLLSGEKIIDTVRTTSGMRSLSWTHGSGTFLLNGEPLFQKLCLDQGYWLETGMTPPSASALEYDIVLAQAMGFNGCRKHQKLEDPIFLYHADRLGYLVWSEAGNAYRYSATYASRFDAEWSASVKRDINHPSIITWTPINESWGYTDLASSVAQRNHIRSLVAMTRVLDSTRPVNDNCGWEHVTDDLSTFHDYADGEALTETCATLGKILGPKAGRPFFCEEIRDENGKVVDPGVEHRDGAPVICTEMGGVNITGGEGDWGYTTAKDSEDLLGRIERLIIGATKGGHICGFVWTQLADIEQEANGLYDAGRKPKVDPGRVKEIMTKAEALYHSLIAGRS